VKKVLFICLFVFVVFACNGCGCFLPCLFGQQIGYNYIGFTPGMRCIAKPGGVLECGPEEIEHLETEVEKQEQQEPSYRF
jgi:hypothetical protein